MKKFYSLFHFIVAPFTTIWYPRFVESFEKQQSDLYGIISKFNKTYLKLFIFVPFFGLLCILYLNTINQQITIYLIIAISLCGLATFVQASLWWARPFSNAVNPNYSIFMNIYVTIILLPSLYIFVNLFGILGGHLSILIVNLAAYLYFRKKLSLLA